MIFLKLRGCNNSYQIIRDIQIAGFFKAYDVFLDYFNYKNLFTHC